MFETDALKKIIPNIMEKKFKIKEEIQESLQQIYQCIFKPLTFTKSIEDWDKKSKKILFLKLSFYSLFLSMIIDTFAGLVFLYFRHAIDWRGIAFGIEVSIAAGITVGIAFGIIDDIALGIAVGIAVTVITVGIAIGITSGIVAGILGATDIEKGIARANLFGIALSIALGIIFGISNGIAGGIAFYTVFLFSYFRVFYILPHLIQYFRVKIFKHEPFSLFQNSPIYWDEVIQMPLLFLSDFLIKMTD